MTDPTCAVAHGEAESETETRTLVAVFDSPVAGYLLKYAADVGYRTVLHDPKTGTLPPLDRSADVVVTDHHRDELGEVLRDVLEYPVRWVGVMGNPRDEGPHVEALKQLGVAPEEIDRVHRPVGLNIGSRTPPEIAIATLAGLLADRAARPGGFHF